MLRYLKEDILPTLSPLIVRAVVGVFLVFLKSTVISLVVPTLRSRLFEVNHSVMLWTYSPYADSSLSFISPMMAVIHELNNCSGVVGGRAVMSDRV